MSKLPQWLIKRTPKLKNIRKMREKIADDSVHTVCESAKCPNIGECYSSTVATFMILGKTCTRKCNFCGVSKGTPSPLDKSEPKRVAEAAKKLGLKYVVVTSVTRDDLPDHGASHFADTIKAIKKELPDSKVEVLIPDLGGNKDLIKKVIDAGPFVLNHNVEMAPRLYEHLRPTSNYKRSLEVLKISSNINKNMHIKSGFMLGVGETEKEIYELMKDLRAAECGIVTIGQYLRPSQKEASVVEYVQPEVFEKYRNFGLNLGFKHVEAGPFVRSSYHADHILTV
ncbi:lipoyl synthase [Candidatus Margulisiibacteriota bacterium]